MGQFFVINFVSGVTNKPLTMVFFAVTLIKTRWDERHYGPSPFENILASYSRRASLLLNQRVDEFNTGSIILYTAMERLRLLIIDENSQVRNALATRLGTMPQLEVLGSVGTALEAEEVVHAATPDVVLIEPKRLNGDGFSLIESLTSVPRPPYIIVLTSYHDEDEEMVVHELGIDCYMLKEIDSNALLDVILSCQNGSHARPA